MTTVYGLFYWSINFGSFFSFAVIPVVKDHFGYAVAFAVPGVFMLLATLVFWMGRKHYVMKPPSATLAPVDAATKAEDRRTSPAWKVAIASSLPLAKSHTFRLRSSDTDAK